MKRLGGVGLPTISTPRQTNQTLVLTIPQNYFRITRSAESPNISFKLTDQAISVLTSEFSAKYLGVRYRKRHYIDFEGIRQIIQIPQAILFYEGKIHYHRVLPDFIIPFCRHTIKTLTAVNQSIQNAEVFDELSVTQSDSIIDAVYDHPRRTHYLRKNLKRIMTRVISALQCLSKYRTRLCMVPCVGFKHISKEYLLTAAETPIRVISYVMDSLWVGGYT